MQVTSNPVASVAASYTSKFATNAQPTTDLDNQFLSFFKIDDSPEAMLKEATQGGVNGLWSWQVKQLTKKVAVQVMNERQLSVNDVMNMPDAKRSQLEDDIVREVEQRVKQLIKQGNDQKTASDHPSFSPSSEGLKLDISV